MWKNRNLRSEINSPAMIDGYIYGCEGGPDTGFSSLRCLDVDTGELMWEEYLGRGVSISLIAADGKLIILEEDGTLHIAEATPSSYKEISGGNVLGGERKLERFWTPPVLYKGKVRWQRNIVRDFNVRPPTWGFAGSPVVEGDLLILNAGVSGLALNKRTGDKVWVSKPGIGGYATPVIYDHKGKRRVAIFGQKAIYGVEADTGREAWSYQWITSYDANAADPLVHENRVFISSNYGSGCALLDISNHKPKLIWKNNNINSHFSAFILSRDFKRSSGTFKELLDSPGFVRRDDILP